jgi:chaperone modulatory protein CbpM
LRRHEDGTTSPDGDEREEEAAMTGSRESAVTSYALGRPARLDLESFARATQTHPDLVGRLVVLGVLDAQTDAAGRLWFSPAQVASMARIKRLRASFSVSYATVGLLCDLLDRIADLEATARASRRSGGERWTPTA